MGERCGATVYEQGTERSPVDIAEWALGQAKSAGVDVLVVDTAGRLHVDEELMDELAAIREADQAARRPAGARRDDRPGRRQRRRELRRAGRLRRRRADQARRRRPRRRRALGQGGDRQADHLRVDRRADRAARALPPRADGLADPRHGRRAVADREGGGGLGRRSGRGARAQDPQAGVHARGLPRPDAPGAQDGPALERARDDARHGQADEAASPGGHGRARARPAGGDHPLDDARPSAPTRR